MVLVKKLSKMANNSTSKSLKSTPNELPQIGGELGRRHTMHSQDTQYLILFLKYV